MLFFFPIGDESWKERIPWVTCALLALNAVVFVVTPTDESCHWLPFMQRWGFSPATWQPITLVTAMFVHADGGHFAGNMAALLSYAPSLEARLGPWLFAALYVLGGIVSHVVFGLVSFGHPAPSVGASGAIAAVMGAYLFVLPRYRVRFAYVLLSTQPRWGLARIEALWLLPVFALFDLINAFLGPGPVNHVAHLAGYAWGYLVSRWLVHRRLAYRDLRDTEERGGARVRRAYREATRVAPPTRAEVEADGLRRYPLQAEKARLFRAQEAHDDVVPLVMDGAPAPAPATSRPVVSRGPLVPPRRDDGPSLELARRPHDLTVPAASVAEFAPAAPLSPDVRRRPVALSGLLLVSTEPLSDERLYAVTRELAYERLISVDEVDRLVRQTGFVIASDLPRTDAGLLAGAAAAVTRGVRLLEAAALRTPNRVQEVVRFGMGADALHLTLRERSASVRWTDLAVVLPGELDHDGERRVFLDLVCTTGTRYRLTVGAEESAGPTLDDVRALARRALKVRPDLDPYGLVGAFATARYASGPVFYHPSHVDACLSIVRTLQLAEVTT